MRASPFPKALHHAGASLFRLNRNEPVPAVMIAAVEHNHHQAEEVFIEPEGLIAAVRSDPCFHEPIVAARHSFGGNGCATKEEGMSWKRSGYATNAAASNITASLIARCAAPDPVQVEVVLEALLADLPQERLEAIAKRIGWRKVSPSAAET